MCKRNEVHWSQLTSLALGCLTLCALAPWLAVVMVSMCLALFTSLSDYSHSRSCSVLLMLCFAVLWRSRGWHMTLVVRALLGTPEARVVCGFVCMMHEEEAFIHKPNNGDHASYVGSAHGDARCVTLCAH